MSNTRHVLATARIPRVRSKIAADAPPLIACEYPDCIKRTRCGLCSYHKNKDQRELWTKCRVDGCATQTKSGGGVPGEGVCSRHNPANAENRLAYNSRAWRRRKERSATGKVPRGAKPATCDDGRWVTPEMRDDADILKALERVAQEAQERAAFEAQERVAQEARDIQ